MEVEVIFLNILCYGSIQGDLPIIYEEYINLHQMRVNNRINEDREATDCLDMMATTDFTSRPVKMAIQYINVLKKKLDYVIGEKDH